MIYPDIQDIHFFEEMVTPDCFYDRCQTFNLVSPSLRLLSRSFPAPWHRILSGNRQYGNDV